MKKILIIGLLIMLICCSYYFYMTDETIEESFSDDYVRDECDNTKTTLKKINNYLSDHCKINKNKTINEELDCRYYDDKAIFFGFNDSSWCTPSEVKQGELGKYLEQANDQSKRGNNYYEREIVGKDIPEYKGELQPNFKKFGTWRGNYYKCKTELSNNYGDPEPIERMYKYRITENDEKTVMNVDNVIGYSKERPQLEY